MCKKKSNSTQTPDSILYLCVTQLPLKWRVRGLTSHKMTSSCLRPFPPLTLAGATEGTVGNGEFSSGSLRVQKTNNISTNLHACSVSGDNNGSNKTTILDVIHIFNNYLTKATTFNIMSD